MDKWDRILVGDEAPSFNTARPRTGFFPHSRQIASPREPRPPPDHTGSGMLFTSLGIADAQRRKQPEWIESGCSPRYGSHVLDFGRQLHGGQQREVVLQAASRSKGAVIWRPSATADVQKNDVCSKVLRLSVGTENQCLAFSPTQPRPPLHARLANGVHGHVDSPVEHRELWAKWEREHSFSPEKSRSPASINISALRGSPLDFGEPQRPPPSPLMCPAPRPLHDFSKDRHDALPQTGHLELLPAPRHQRMQDSPSEATIDLLQEERVALAEERKRSFLGRSNDDSCKQVFDAFGSNGRSIKMTSASEVETRIQGVSAVATEIGERGDHSDKQELAVPAMTRYMDPCYTLQDQNDKTLVFESRFECGNLAKAYRITENEYDLELSPDTKTRGHTQWFYFSIRNMRKGKMYVLNITNFCKPHSLYTNGLRPLMYSEKRSKQDSIGWSRCGSKICYFSNAKCPVGGGRAGGVEQDVGHCGLSTGSGKLAEMRKRDEAKFTLSFEIEFPHDFDTVYLAHCYPYSYRDMQEHLDSLDANVKRRKFIRRRVLTRTIANNDLEVITITSNCGSYEVQQARPVIIMSARVHPGETNASWMMKGILNFLTDPSDPVAAALRESCEFRIVPMLNPDGVINGNYRCNLAGFDLNRHWKHPSMEQHPTIHAHKNMVQQLCKDRNVLLVIDLHGHSTRRNVFIYGCHAKYWPSVDGENGLYGPPPPVLHEQIYPFLLSEENESFSFKDCRFKVQRCKASTGRVVCWKECKVVNSYTLEASFCGPDQGPGKGLHFSTRDLEKMGESVCKSLHKYLQLRQDSQRLGETVRLIEILRDGIDKHQEMEDADNADSSSDENIDDLVESASRRAKNRRAKKPPEQTSDAEEVDTVEPWRPRERPKETSKEIIERLARPKRMTDKKKREVAFAVPWQAPGALNDEPASAKQSPTRLMHRVRHELDAIAALNKEANKAKRAKEKSAIDELLFGDPPGEGGEETMRLKKDATEGEWSPLPSRIRRGSGTAVVDKVLGGHAVAMRGDTAHDNGNASPLLLGRIRRRKSLEEMSAALDEMLPATGQKTQIESAQKPSRYRARSQTQKPHESEHGRHSYRRGRPRVARTYESESSCDSHGQDGNWIEAPRPFDRILRTMSDRGMKTMDFDSPKCTVERADSGDSEGPEVDVEVMFGEREGQETESLHERQNRKVGAGKGGKRSQKKGFPHRWGTKGR